MRNLLCKFPPTNIYYVPYVNAFLYLTLFRASFRCNKLSNTHDHLLLHFFLKCFHFLCKHRKLIKLIEMIRPSCQALSLSTGLRRWKPSTRLTVRSNCKCGPRKESVKRATLQRPTLTFRMTCSSPLLLDLE